MARLLGLDIGEKTIGLAVSDEGGVIASPLSTIARHGGRRDLEAVAAALVETGATELIIGLPLGLDGNEGLAARRARRLGDALAAHCTCPVHYWDERFSTCEAERVLLAADMSRARRKKVIDQVAATVILQSWLDAASSGPTGTREDERAEETP